MVNGDEERVRKLRNGLNRRVHSLFLRWTYSIHRTLILGASRFLRCILIHLSYMQTWMLSGAWRVRKQRWQIRKQNNKKESILK
ncbi:hypothetical protein HZF08_18060 [Paenibacillus sp. CGMCC 1.16610]|uniref:hypothetical protein n=1 Tax=Paenibacillus anseongense TaxID=2682845 RepID=UPI0012FBFAA6|nr:hypothetical protein [Paenibacillus anseongense]MBA2940224.1 hypothetical protein [Paenibacillus sp. CGMCC 1.16610]